MISAILKSYLWCKIKREVENLILNLDTCKAVKI